jgi:ClpX C4-type zinc finger
MVDEELLATAKQAGEQLIEAEENAEVARAEFHRAIRRLHLRGASMRELADALQLSHQRIHQIVDAAGGARRWRRRERTPLELSCSFCGRPQRKTRKLIAGPGVYICEKCVEVADSVIASGRGEKTTLSRVEPVPANAKGRRCSFCGKHRHQLTGLATTIDNPVLGKLKADAAICAECLTLCQEIHAENLT